MTSIGNYYQRGAGLGVMNYMLSMLAPAPVSPHRALRKRAHISYDRDKQRRFTKILPEVCARWDAPEAPRPDSRQVRRAKDRENTKALLKTAKAMARESMLKGGSAPIKSLA